MGDSPKTVQQLSDELKALRAELSEAKKAKTQHDQAQEDLRRSEEKYRGIFDESVAAIYVFDENKNFIDSNQAGLDLLGYTRDELLTMSIPDVDADPVVVLPAHQQLLSGDRIVNYEHQLERKDGTVITVINNSKPLTDKNERVIGMQSTLIDISNRKAAAEQLRRSEERFRNLVELLPEGVFETDAEGKITFVNQAIIDSTGYTREDFDTGLKVEKLLDPGDKQRALGHIERVLHGEHFSGNEYTIARKDGTTMPILVYSKPIIVTGEIVGMRGLIIDISEKKQAEDERQRLEARIQHTQKLESLGVLAGGIAHDFNNLLMGILGSADLALMRITPNSPGHENIIDIRKTSSRAADLCKQMLAYSGKGSFVIQQLNFNSLIKDLADCSKYPFQKQQSSNTVSSPICHQPVSIPHKSVRS